MRAGGDKRTCGVDGCARDLYSLGLCLAHYTRQRRTGSTGSAQVWDRQRPKCSIDGCETPARVRGMCLNHDRRVQKHGSPDYVPPMRYGPDNGSWRDNDIGYTTAHDRVRSLRGPARTHRCVDCGSQARHWSYDHTDPDERRHAHGGWPYSVDPEHYVPRCVPCHKRFDLALKKAS